MCDSCSTKADEIVLHQLVDCPAPAYIHDMPTYVDLQPDFNRISGPQMKGRKNAKKKKSTTFPCKIQGCDNHTNPRKAFRKAHTANTHMSLEHKMTEEEFDSIKYPVVDDNPAQPMAPARSDKKKQKKPADSQQGAEGHADQHHPNQLQPIDADNEEQHEVQGEGDNNNNMGNNIKPKRKVGKVLKRARRGARAKEYDNDEESTDGDMEPSESEESPESDEDNDPTGSDNDGMSADGASDEDAEQEDEDPDEAVDIPENMYVVETIINHRLLAGGKHKYLIKWQGWDKTTWEPQQSASEELRKEYHAAVEDRTRAEKTIAEEQRKKKELERRAQGINVRSSRSRPSATSAAARKKQVEVKANALIKTGVAYHMAHEQAEKEVPL
jgi:hypothetical protein